VDRDNFYVFGHAAFVNVRVDGHRAENCGVIAPVEKTYDSLLNGSFRQRIVHDNLAESQASINEHCDYPF
jgi:hypothetical protein